MKTTKRKPAAKKSVKARQPKTKYVLVLRTCNADMTSSHGFVWPTKGKVEASDWIDSYKCGNGLHGLLWGEGDGSLLNWNEDAKWLVVRVAETDLRHGQGDMVGKCKFQSGQVVFCGDRKGATEYLRDNGCDGKVIVGSAVVAGYGGQATAGDGGQATAGDMGQATAGDMGIVVLRFWDARSARYRLAVGYPGEDGIEAGKKYRLDDAGKFIEVKDP